MANAPEKNPAHAQRDLAAAVSTLASRPAPTLTGRERAAVLMLALGEQYGAKIWGMLDDDELRQLSVAMSSIGAIEADVVENLLLEFVTRMSASGALMGSYEATERLLQQYLPPERVSAIMETIRGPAGRNMWEKLSSTVASRPVRFSAQKSFPRRHILHFAALHPFISVRYYPPVFRMPSRRLSRNGGRDVTDGETGRQADQCRRARQTLRC